MSAFFPQFVVRGESISNHKTMLNRALWIVSVFSGVLVLLAGTYFISRAWDIRRVDHQYRVPMLYAPTNYLRTSTVSGLQKQTSVPDVSVASDITISSRDVQIDRTSVRVYIYQSQIKKPHSAGLLWIHGGGLVLGNARADTEFLQPILHALNIVVVSAEYRLPPQHPYPQPLDDCFAALVWMHDHADELGVDARRIAVGGGSAGAGLAAALVQRAHDDGRVKPVFQVLMYPMIDDRTTLKTETKGRGRLVWTAQPNLFGWKSYLGQTPQWEDDRPYAAAARRKDLSGLPSAWIGVGDLDLFYDEDVEYCRRLQAAGVSCKLDIVPNAYHGFNLLAKKAPGSIAFDERMIDALRVELEATPQP
jgi:acetyl esterase/lipase